MPYTQRGKNDCGLFALSYIESIVQLEDPSIIVYDQYMMRRAYNAFVDSDLSNLNVHILQNYSKRSYPRISRADYVNIPDLRRNSMSIISLIEKFNE